MCPEGSYCPNATAIIECPKGYYCPLGSDAPIKCDWLAICNPGSIHGLQLQPLFFLIIFDVLLAGYIFSYYLYRSIKHKEYMRTLLSKDHSSENATKLLIKGIAKSKGRTPYIDFEFEDLGLSLPGKKKILQGVTGSIKHGQVTAILGPSGAGKTTFINTLMGKINSDWKSEGNLYINGELKKSISSLKKYIGYVPQEDIMIRELSVWQNIKYSADIKLPRDWTSQERREYVEAIINVLNLQNVRNSPIGDENTRGISGGQRKRVNIGIELASAPLALFCDEPTSGLDSSSSLSVVYSMKTIAQSTGITVIMVIHQPRMEIWNCLDKILLLAPGGITVYLGEQKHCQTYFKKYLGVEFNKNDNPADIIMDAISKNGSKYAEIWRESGLEWYKNYVSSFEEKLKDNESNLVIRKTVSVLPQLIEEDIDIENIISEDNSNDKIIRGANFFKQFWYAHIRSVKQQYLSLESLILELGLAAFAGFIIGFSTQEHYSGVAIEPYTPLSPSHDVALIPQKGLFMGMSIGIAAASAGVKTFGEDRTVYYREAASGHNKLAYYLGVTTSVIYRIILGGFHFTSLYQILSRTYTSYWHSLIGIVLIYYSVYGLSSIVSMITPRKDAPLLAVVATIIATVMNGYVTNIPYFLKVLSYAYWFNEGYFEKEVDFAKSTTIVSFTADVFGYVTDRFVFDMFMVFIIGTVYRIIAYILMIFIRRDKQK